MDISKLPVWDKLAIERALREAQNSVNQGNLSEAEAALVRVENILKPHQTETDLARKREERLLRETWKSLSPDQRAEFEKTQGHTATIRRLAAEARRLADEDFEKRETQGRNEEYEKGRWQGNPDRNRLPGANYDKIFELEAQSDQRRATRLEARKQRELAAEAYDEELPRVVASLDREELEFFYKLMDKQPTPLEAVTRFAQEKAPNPLEGITDSSQLYEMGLSSNKSNESPEIWGTNSASYNVAFQQMKDEIKGE